MADGDQSLSELQREKTCYKLNIDQKTYVRVWDLFFEFCNVIMNFQTNLKGTRIENRMKTTTYYKQNAKTLKNKWTAIRIHLSIQKKENMQNVLGKVP